MRVLRTRKNKQVASTFLRSVIVAISVKLVLVEFDVENALFVAKDKEVDPGGDIGIATR